MSDLQEVLDGLANDKGNKATRKSVGKYVRNCFTNAKTLADVLDNGMRELYEKAAPIYADELCAIVLRLDLYTNAEGAYRRSFRSEDPKDYRRQLSIITKEILIDLENFDLLAYLKNSDKQKRDNRYLRSGYLIIAMLTSLKIDQNDKAIIEAVKDIILSENNTLIVVHELLRSVAMSHNTELHNLLKDLLLAAKLQEGLRQAILETADDGVLDYFKLIIKTVLENDLMRFSSALRAVCVWAGFGYNCSERRPAEKVLRLCYQYLDDEAERNAAMNSMDTTEIYACMWAESVYSIQNLQKYIERYMKGEKHQKMVAAYFLSQIDSTEYCIKVAGEALIETELDVLTLIFLSYDLSLYNVLEGDWHSKSKTIDMNKYPNCIKSEKTRSYHFLRLSEIIEQLPKNGHTVTGKPFEWCVFTLERSTIFDSLMAICAYDFDDSKHTRLMELFPLAESPAKINFLNYFIERELNDKNRKFLFDSLSDKSMQVRAVAAAMIKKISIDDMEILKVEALLALKTGNIRQIALDIIRNAGNDIALASAKRNIANKNVNKRLAALDLLVSLKKTDSIAINELPEIIKSIPEPTNAETILINNLIDSEATEYNEKNGFGLYDPDYFPDLAPIERNENYDLAAFRNISADDMTELFDTLLALIDKHKEYTFKTFLCYGDGRDCILGTERNLGLIEKIPYGEPIQIEHYVLGDVWRAWFETNKDNLMIILKISYCMDVHRSVADKYSLSHLQPFAKELIENSFGCDDIEKFHNNKQKDYFELATSIISMLLIRVADESELFKISYGVLADFFLSTASDSWSKNCYAETSYFYKHKRKLAQVKEVCFFVNKLKARNEAQYKDKLSLCYAIGDASDSRYIALSLNDISNSAHMGILEESELRRAEIEIDGTRTISMYTGNLQGFAKAQAEKNPILLESVDKVVKRIIEIELKRGDSKTAVSELAIAIKRHEGAEVFAEILAALGKETLVRGYIWYSDCTKREVLSSLLKASVPAKSDDAETLKAALRGRISEKRLLEATMYAPAWISIVEELLKWEGLKCAAWYFHAHTRSSYSSEFETEVARFSPIEKEDFQRGAFDINWFKEAFQTLGQERFNMLYDCAKYISKGAEHRRAQLFADAVLGKLNTDEMEPQIRDKRNKDLLLSYSLVPFADNTIMQEALRRYTFINEFLKKSRTFGAQRQASEKNAANIALQNLARNLGYADVLRFSWKMEMEKLDVIQDYFRPHSIGPITLFLEMEDSGQSELIIDKAGKRLKSIPASIKKDEYVKEISEVKKSLKEQYSRARVSLERAMESKDEFSFHEVSELLGHPVISPILSKLVFRTGNELGFLSDDGLLNTEGSVITVDNEENLRIAHCHDLFDLGKWHDFQRYAFDNGLVQPFKQIFRELYIVNEDEKSEGTISRRYAGNQIQPKRAAALLKTRGWTVNYESGWQKVYHKENVIAEMYALADWFSPSDVEAPTLEAVRFFGSKTVKPLVLEEIDPILFSEIMRDIDLVVSVAHVGGVDPMTSHSTVEMRGVIVAESIRLLKLENVDINDRHARISGSLGEFSVHLGSGLAHMMGRGALNILPVHSQHRGRIFLPFIDEDPKTAEIVSKVLLLAEDSKIKDPAILAQIR